MSKFVVLTGSKLNTAIQGFGKAVATFSEREHQLAYSALNHVELHNDPKYLNALYAVTPVNYRKGLVSWSNAFGKVAFDKASATFKLAKTKTSDMPTAFSIAPAAYERAAGKETSKAAFDEVKYLERVIAKMEDEGASPRVLQAVKGALTLARMPAVAETAPAKPSKPAKAKTVKVPAAVAPAQAEMPLAAAA